MYSWAWVPKQGGVEEGGVGGILIFYRGESNSYGGLIKYLLPGIFALFQELLLRTFLTRGAAAGLHLRSEVGPIKLLRVRGGRE